MMHWTNKKPKQTGRWAMRWHACPGGWKIVHVWRHRGRWYANDTALSEFGKGYQWSSEPYPEPLEKEENT